tara:strand:- start:2553 stop:2924 length:372 start_codon:yes stop_codon:yes gene_type:complete
VLIIVDTPAQLGYKISKLVVSDLKAARQLILIRAFLRPGFLIMLENVDPNIVFGVIGLFATFAVQLVGLGKIYGMVSSKLSAHDEQHIRHQTRLDEHATIISQHDKDIAVLTDRQIRGDGTNG